MTPPDDSIARFWSWFADNHAEIAAIASGDDPRWDAALERLQRVDQKLRFEISEPVDGVREFVITAEGEVSRFATVDALAAAAPEIEGFRVVALKPAMGFDFVTTYEGERFDPRAMWFLPLKSASRPASLGVRVGVPGMTEAGRRRAENAVRVILDTALGERAAATAFEVVQAAALPADPEAEGYIELPELPAYLEWHAKRARGC